MEVRADVGAAQVELVRAAEFDALSVQARAGDRDLAALAALLGGRPDDGDHVWVPAGRLAALAGDVDEQWRLAYRSMLAKVEPYGWFDAATQEVKLHVEWAGVE